MGSETASLTNCLVPCGFCMSFSYLLQYPVLSTAWGRSFCFSPFLHLTITTYLTGWGNTCSILFFVRVRVEVSFVDLSESLGKREDVCWKSSLYDPACSTTYSPSWDLCVCFHCQEKEVALFLSPLFSCSGNWRRVSLKETQLKVF